MTSAVGRPVRVPDSVLSQHLGDGELVFLDLATERYFGLDATGAAMWDALTATGDADAALAVLAERFTVGPEELRRDLDALIARLVAQGLLRVGDDA